MSIIDKLKIGNVKNVLILNKPDNVRDFDTLSYDTKDKKEKYNLIIVFIFSIEEFVQNLKKIIEKEMLNSNGYVYFVYPKKGNKEYTQFIGRDDFFGPAGMDKDGYALGSKLKFNKMVSFNDTFTVIGLKYLERKQKESAAKPSQIVADYVDRIPDLKKYFSDNKQVLALFNELTPGYQRGWARFIYSTKSEETRLKRLATMEEVLKEGYKSIDLYRQGKNKI